ncbi:sigma-54 interaction domain-containing protein [Cohnella sp. GCM10027633]|uniref:sigma-54 interaction domain-containing protein n=1 Tax=unclassified Cohnella TaxID=2636738 RepID=UPI00363358F6
MTSSPTRSTRDNDPFSAVIGDSLPLRSAVDMARRLAKSSSALLLTGETGVGKEVFARAIHASGETAGSPFIAVNCGAIMASLVESELFGYERGAFSGADPRGKPGKIELAGGGTLFLDEIGEMAPDLQAKLLRILEDREYYQVGGTRPLHSNCRFIAATNRDLAALVEQGRFREDLYYRLNVLALDIPPLRRRVEDIPLLANAFLRRSGYDLPLSDAMASILIGYPWPGNVRELRNAMERLRVLSPDGPPSAEDLPPAIVAGTASAAGIALDRPLAGAGLPERGTLPEWLADCERGYIEAALAETNDNKQAAAQRLGISRMTLYNKLALLFDRDA